MVFIFGMPHMILGPQDYIFYNGNTSHFSLYIIFFGPNYFFLCVNALNIDFLYLEKTLLFN